MIVSQARIGANGSRPSPRNYFWPPFRQSLPVPSTGGPCSHRRESRSSENLARENERAATFERRSRALSGREGRPEGIGQDVSRTGRSGAIGSDRGAPVVATITAHAVEDVARSASTIDWR